MIEDAEKAGKIAPGKVGAACAGRLLASAPLLLACLPAWCWG